MQLPSEFTNTLSTANYSELIAFNFVQSESKIMIFPSKRSSKTQVNETIKYCELDMANNYAIAVNTFTNNTAGYIPPNSYDEYGRKEYGCTYPFFVTRHYVICVSVDSKNKSKVCVVKRNDNTQVKVMHTVAGDNILYQTTSLRIRPVFWNENIALISLYDGNISFYKIIEFDTGIAIDTNIKSITQSNTVDIGNGSVFASTGGNLRYSMTFNPFILCTKNNLDSPVTKTASQTMKITYTLSVADTTGSEV